MAVMVSLWLKNLITTLQVNFELIPSEAEMRTQTVVIKKIFRLTIAASWLPPDFTTFHPGYLV